MRKLEIATAIERLKQQRPEIAVSKRGLPDTGKRNDETSFYSDLQRIDQAYRNGNEVYSMQWTIDSNLVPFNSGNGSPLRYPPFPPSVEAGIKALSDSQISQYAYAAGDANCRKIVADYLFSIGIRSNEQDGRICPNQVIFFNSTTEAFSMVLKVICRKGDVVLFTAPTYGLFAYEPERIGAISKFIDLKIENGWLLDPSELENRILQINNCLQRENEVHKSHTPRVVAFVNLNPCNPTGLVMDDSEKKRLYDISLVCQRNGVFIIDDIIYRDLCYNMDKQAVPVASLKNAFSNTITLFGTSKSFGLAGARAGSIVADEAIIRGLRNEIFQHMDSTPLQLSYIIAGAFQISPEYATAYNNYFEPLIRIYKENWQIVKTLIYGENDRNELITSEIITEIRNEFQDDAETVLENGIPRLSIAGGIEPQSGFFALIDFSSLLGMYHYSAQTPLKDEMDILYYFYQYANVKLLTSSSFAWPVPEQVVARVSYAYQRNELIRMFYQLYYAIKQLVCKNEENCNSNIE